MTKVDPQSSRIQIVDAGPGYEIVIPAKMNWFTAPFLAFWLCAWAVGLHTVLNKLMSGAAGSSSIFLMAWLGAWLVGGAAAMVSLIWILVGREVVRVTASELQYIRTYGLFSRKREYDMNFVKRLRVSPLIGPSVYARANTLPGFSSTGIIAFDYGASTPRFGYDLDEAEARALVETLTGRFKNLAASAS